MKLAFCLFRYFPFGGLQRDFKRIAEVCLARGHSINVFTTSWEGNTPAGFNITFIPGRGITNHQRSWNFSKEVNRYLTKEQFDAVIGFNKMYGLDVYYAADPCLKAKIMEEKGSLSCLLPRYRTYLDLEKAVFEPAAGTHILLISDVEKPKYIKYYRTPENLFHTLPPGISRDRAMKDNIELTKKSMRKEFNISDDKILLLMVGSGYKTKGLDRSIKALASLPEGLKKRSELFVVGEGKSEPFRRLADSLKISGQIHFIGGREDVPYFMTGADLLLHPAYTENTGTVLIEAMAAGLPVLATDICGYACHIEKAGSGLLVRSPFQQKKLDRLLEYMLTTPEREKWKRNGLKYVAENDVFSMPEKAAEIIESVAGK